MSRVVLVQRSRLGSTCVWQDDEGHYRMIAGDENTPLEAFQEAEADPSTTVDLLDVASFKALEALRRKVYGWPEFVVEEGPGFRRAMCVALVGASVEVYWKDAKGEYRMTRCTPRDAKNLNSLEAHFRMVERRTKQQAPATYPEALRLSVLVAIQKQEFEFMGLTTVETMENRVSRRLRLRRDDRNKREMN